MIIRTEQQADQLAVYRLNEKAFGGPDESELIERIRVSNGFIPSLSIVAEVEDEIVGHILLSKAVVAGEKGDVVVLVLAPVAVDPVHQRKGIGGRLIREALKRAKEAGYGLVLLIGHPSYYPKFGFKPARQFRIELKQFQVPDEVFMVHELVEGELGTVKGELIYPPPFFTEPDKH